VVKVPGLADGLTPARYPRGVDVVVGAMRTTATLGSKPLSHVVEAPQDVFVRSAPTPSPGVAVGRFVQTTCDISSRRGFLDEFSVMSRR